MSVLEHKLNKYYMLKKHQKLLEKRIKELNEDLKQELEPGEHQIGGYKVSYQLKKKYDLDAYSVYGVIDPSLYQQITREVIDPDLVESTYLAGLMSDDELKTIRGDCKIIQSLSIDKVEGDV